MLATALSLLLLRQLLVVVFSHPAAAGSLPMQRGLEAAFRG